MRIGNGAKTLGLEGAVEVNHFEARRNNLHPFTGKRLTARKRDVSKVRKAIALHERRNQKNME